MVIWLVGLSGSGKTTIGKALREKIIKTGKSCVFIDGDILRELAGQDLTYSVEDRKKSASRMIKLCKYLDEQGVNVISGIVYVAPGVREWNKANIRDYYEVFVDAPLEVLKERDAKGLYRKALSGELQNVIGLDIPFEMPPNPDFTIVNDFQTSAAKLADMIYKETAYHLQ